MKINKACLEGCRVELAIAERCFEESAEPMLIGFADFTIDSVDLAIHVFALILKYYNY